MTKRNKGNYHFGFVSLVYPPRMESACGHSYDPPFDILKQPRLRVRCRGCKAKMRELLLHHRLNWIWFRRES